MDSKLQEELESKTDQLINVIKKYKTESILGYIFNQIQLPMGNIFEHTGLSSPYRQYLYLAGLLLSNEIDDNPKMLDESNVEEINSLLEEIALCYSKMYFPTEQEFSEDIDDRWKKARRVSMPAFLHYFNTTQLNYSEQQVERIERWYLPYDSFFKDETGISVSELLDIYCFIKDSLQKQINNLQEDFEYIDKHREFFLDKMEGGELDYQGMLTLSRDLLAGKAKSLRKNIALINHIKIEKLREEFNEAVIDTFLKYFTIERKERDFRYYTQNNPFESWPIWKKNNQYIFISILKQVLNAISSFLEKTIGNTDKAESFYRHRGSSVEKQVEDILQTLFKDEADFYNSVYEDAEAHDEHDLVIFYKGKILIVESKASSLREPFRDPDKAFERIKSDFKSETGIQKAYNQAKKLKDKLYSSTKTKLFNENGDVVKEVIREEIDDIYLISITSEDWGALASNLSLLLEKEDSEPYPWSCNLYNLESLIEGFLYKGFEIADFIKYLDQRRKYHEKLFASDELEIAGMFITKNGLDEIGELEMDIIFFTPDMSDIFDEIYFEKKGIENSFSKDGDGTVFIDMKKEFGLS